MNFFYAGAVTVERKDIRHFVINDLNEKID